MAVADRNGLVRKPHQPLDVKGVRPDADPFLVQNVVGVEHDDFAAPGPREMIAHLVDEDMVALPHAAGSDDLPFLHVIARIEVQLHAMVGIDEGTIGAHGEPHQMDLGADAVGVLVVLHPLQQFQPARGLRLHFDIALAEHREIHRIQREAVVPLFSLLRPGGHPVERGLHRPGRNLERLDEIGAAGHRHGNRDHQHLEVFAPLGKGARRHQPFRGGGGGIANGLQPVPLARAPGGAQRRVGRARGRDFPRRPRVFAHVQGVPDHVAGQMDRLLQSPLREKIHAVLSSSPSGRR